MFVKTIFIAFQARHGLLSGKDRNGGDKKLLPLGDPNWTVVNEYDPLWPNDYTKVVSGNYYRMLDNAFAGLCFLAATQAECPENSVI